MTETTDSSRVMIALAIIVPLALLSIAAMLLWSPKPAPATANAEIAALSQSIPLHAAAASNGNGKAYESLEQALGRLAQLETASELPGSAGLWDRLKRDSAAVLSARNSQAAVQQANRVVADRMAAVLAGGQTVLGAAGAPEVLQRFEGAADTLLRSIEGLANGTGDIDQLSVAASTSVDYMSRVIGVVNGGSDPHIDLTPGTDESFRTSAGELTSAFEPVATSSAEAVAEASSLLALRESSRALTRTADTLFTQTTADTDAPVESSLPWPSLLLLSLAFLSSLALARGYLRATRVAASAGQQADQNERNQQAILRLLDELGSLADGDLTVQASVTDDITGAIADSINYAIEALRDLVATINDTAIMVDSAAKQTEAAGQHMNTSAGLQAAEVEATTDALGALVASIEEVSGNAERSSDVARHSVDVAHKGGEAVRRTIDGMNVIRETIQETSKRIKRLGESSQEIGNIIELINDIAEQTNILALNASIQASMAGEAGRGFAVVADEVQRLAERSTNATKQIEVLVRTIQTDTNEAVVSMERSTTDVVGGALLAENAGAALDEIEQVSNQIASLVQNISGSAREQSTVAADIDMRTTNLKSISDQASRETADTAAAIHKLSELASQLRKTVAGFQLPDIGVNSGVLTDDLDADDESGLFEPPSRTARQA